MKFFVVLSLLFVTVTATSRLQGEKFQDESKIASGQLAKKGENMDFCLLLITFQSKSQSCGCFIYSEKYVVTSARCVFDFSEGVALNVTVNLPQASGKDANVAFSKVIVPDGTNGAAAIPAYDPASDSPLIKFGASNIALVELSTAIILDGKRASKANISTDADLAAFQIRTRDLRFRACGNGVTDNAGQRPKGQVFCTDVNPIYTGCGKNLNGEDVEVPANGICLQWTNRDNNLCISDYGGPIWAYTLDSKGKVNQEVFCVSVGSPDARPAAPCLDAHKVFCMFLPGSPTLTWIKNVVSPPAAAAGRF